MSQRSPYDACPLIHPMIHVFRGVHGLAFAHVQSALWHWQVIHNATSHDTHLHSDTHTFTTWPPQSVSLPNASLPSAAAPPLHSAPLLSPSKGQFEASLISLLFILPLHTVYCAPMLPLPELAALRPSLHLLQLRSIHIDTCHTS